MSPVDVLESPEISPKDASAPLGAMARAEEHFHKGALVRVWTGRRWAPGRVVGVVEETVCAALDRELAARDDPLGVAHSARSPEILLEAEWRWFATHPGAWAAWRDAAFARRWEPRSHWKTVAGPGDAP